MSDLKRLARGVVLASAVCLMLTVSVATGATTAPSADLTQVRVAGVGGGGVMNVLSTFSDGTPIAGGDVSGLFVRQPSGAWVPRIEGVPNNDAMRIASIWTSPSDDDLAYVLAGSVADKPGGGYNPTGRTWLLKTINQGASWTIVSTGLESDTHPEANGNNDSKDIESLGLSSTHPRGIGELL